MLKENRPADEHKQRVENTSRPTATTPFQRLWCYAEMFPSCGELAGTAPEPENFQHFPENFAPRLLTNTLQDGLMAENHCYWHEKVVH